MSNFPKFEGWLLDYLGISQYEYDYLELDDKTDLGLLKFMYAVDKFKYTLRKALGL